jgi:hypothetical protein
MTGRPGIPIQIDRTFDLSVAGANVEFIPPGVTISQLVCVLLPAGGAATYRLGPAGPSVSVTPSLVRSFLGGYNQGVYLSWPALASGGLMEMLALVKST